MEEITLDDGALSVKKQFVSRAFFPMGPLACKEMGIIPASDEVSDEETMQAAGELAAAVDSWSDFIMTRCNWYVQANNALMAADEHVPERELTSHLTAFALSIMVDERLAR